MYACGELMNTITPPPPWAIICRDCAAEQMKGAPHRHVHGPLKAREIGLIKRLAIAIDGVAHGDVEPPEFADHATDHLLDGLVVRHVGANRERPASRAADLFGGRFRFVGVRMIVDRHIGAGLGQPDGDAAADAAAGASDECSFSGEGHGRVMWRVVVTR